MFVLDKMAGILVVYAVTANMTANAFFWPAQEQSKKKENGK